MLDEPEWVQTDPWTRLREEGGLDVEELRRKLPDDMHDWAYKMAQGLLKKDVARRWIGKWSGSGDNRVRTAGDVLGERLVRLASLLAIPDGDVTSHGGPAGEDSIEARIQLAMRGLLAVPYLWTDNVMAEMPTLPEPPRHVISRNVLPEPRMWWTTTNAYDAVGGDGRTIQVRDFEVITDEGPCISLASVGQPEQAFLNRTGEQSIIWQRMDYGKTFPDDFTVPAERAAVGQVLAKLAFLNSPFIPKRRESPTRAERRGAMREGVELSDVTFLDLRKIMVRKVGPDGDGVEVNWKHQWIVRGHYRAQWYPSRQAHHVIYIPPYLKGPEDAPMLTHVNRVKR